MKAIRFQRLKDGLKYGPITDDITSEWDEDMTDLYYRKAEVDAKIAELDGEIVRLREALQNYVFKFGNCGDAFDRAAKALGGGA